MAGDPVTHHGGGEAPKSFLTRFPLPRHYRLQMTAHICQSDIERLARHDLNTTEWARVRRHLFECDSCLRRLIDVEAPLITNEPTGGKCKTVPNEAFRAYVY
jgi:hypothetical protein